MIAVPLTGPLTLDVSFDDTRAWGTVRTGASGAYVGKASGSVLNGGTQLNLEAPLSGLGSPDGLVVRIALNLADGHAAITFRLNGGEISGPATLTRTN